MKRTALYEAHCAAGAKLVDFAGWEMPLSYDSQIAEHHGVREKAGMFDVSHMGIIDISGSGAKDYLRYVLANDVDKLKVQGAALYTCMLNEAGGILDDLLVYWHRDDIYHLVVNAATTEKDLQWFRAHSAAFDVKLAPRKDTALLAIQGPEAINITQGLLLDAKDRAQVKLLKPFQGLSTAQGFIARTGYTGEQGYEVLLPAEKALSFWQSLLAAGVKPCGLGARDTLRLEAGLNLYGTDMDETVTPFESNLGWTVAFTPNTRNFIGREALQKCRDTGIKQQLVGVCLRERGVLRNGLTVVLDNDQKGIITSGSFSPTLRRGIGLVRIPAGNFTQCHIQVRKQCLQGNLVKPPFIKKP